MHRVADKDGIKETCVGAAPAGGELRLTLRVSHRAVLGSVCYELLSFC